MIWITSDLHFFHDREFIFKPRGFHSCEEMNLAYINEWKSKVKIDDDIYICGDFCLSQNYDAICQLIRSLPGRIHLVLGNHDTEVKIEFYKEFPNIVSISYAEMLIYHRRRFLLSHYITETATLESNPKTCVINLHGHLHVKEKFHESKPYLYNVSVDANNNHFVSLDEIEAAFKNKVKECENYL